MDYFAAATMLSQMVDAGTNINNVARIPFWENYFPAAAGGTVLGCAPGAVPGSVYTATQTIYDMWICTGSAHNETTALQNLDTPYTYTGDECYPACSTVKGQYGPYHFFSPQFNSLYAWRSNGVSSYHGMLVSLRHRMASGLQFDFNYTLSKSMDMGSDAERVTSTEWGGLGGQIINAWAPRQKYGLSDFDSRHQINANWTYELPVGRGKRWGGSWNGFLNHLAGGWAISGLALDEQIGKLDRAVAQAAESHPQAQLLMTQPGVGPNTALAFALTIGDGSRFPRGKQVASYLGLIPREETSGGRQKLGAISKQGNRLLRSLLVEAAQIAVRYDPQLRREYLHRCHQKPKAVAKVAAARKLAVRLYWMLRTQTGYPEIVRIESSPRVALVGRTS